MLLIAWLVGCEQAPPVAAPALPPAAILAEVAPTQAEVVPTWPAPGALHAPPVIFPDDFGQPSVVVDPGHGAPGNIGNTSVYCEHEEDFTLRVATVVEKDLTATGHFDVRATRSGEQRPVYADRVTEADRADAFVSLHADSRNGYELWSPTPGASCPRFDGSPGFAVLYSDEGDAIRVSRRVRLAEAIAARMTATGFLPYDGGDYSALYEPADGEPGVFVDRHAPHWRIFVLRAPHTPSVIVETHEAWNKAEADRWREPATLHAFAQALAGAFVDALR